MVVRSRILLATSSIIFSTFFVVLWIWMPGVIYPAPDGPPAGASRTDLALHAQREATYVAAVTGTRAALIAGLIGVGAVASAMVNAANARTARSALLETSRSYQVLERDRQKELAHREEELGQVRADSAERRITELYSAGAAMLGSPNAAVRLAGVYALERLGVDATGQRWMLASLFCAYLRMPFDRPSANRPSDGPALDAWSTSVQEAQVRSAVLDVLCRHRNLQEKGEFWSAPDLDLRAAELSHSRLVKIDLTGSNLTNANLAGAQLDGSRLVKAELGACNLESASLVSCNLRAVDLMRSDCSGADFARADLTAARLQDSDFSDVDFRRARFASANLSGANLEGAMLPGADLVGSYWSSATSWPDGVEERAIAVSSEVGPDLFRIGERAAPPAQSRPDTESVLGA